MRTMCEVGGGGDEESTIDKKTRERQQHGPEYQVRIQESPGMNATKLGIGNKALK